MDIFHYSDHGATLRILVIGSRGQLGSDLIPGLAERYGASALVTADIAPSDAGGATHEILDVTDREALRSVVSRHRITQIYHLAAALSARAEIEPQWAWQLNMNGLLNVLEVAREMHLDKVFWPSSIAAFGPSTPRRQTPQTTVMDPTTVYGLSKLAGERWCAWYFQRYGVDVRSLRYPGLIGYRAAPGGGTTDYAVEIFHEALRTGRYRCFLAADQSLPLMYMDDAIRATIEIMEAPAAQVRERSSYNLAGVSVSPAELAAEIAMHVPNFSIDYAPDFRQAIAASWPRSIDDARAREDWGWEPRFNLSRMVKSMIEGVALKAAA